MARPTVHAEVPVVVRRPAAGELGPGEPCAWFGGMLARDLVEVTDDPGRLDEEGWWAVVQTFEGALVAGRFADVRQAPLPRPGRAWRPLDAGWRSSLDRAAYVEAVREVRRRVELGEVYQVNVCRVLEHDLAADADLLALAQVVARGNPSPYAGYVRLPGTEVVTASPELFVRRDGDRLLSGPIKGTARTPDGLQDKDVAENVMITDLVRNDLSHISVPGSVAVPDLLAVEEHPGLVHLVSRVAGTLRPGAGWAQVLEALSPPGSVSGAPKSTALQAIAALEPVPRGPYCGAVGWVDGRRRRAELAVGIRTFWAADAGAGRRVLRFGTGAGITWGSDPEGEWAETELKAERLTGLASGRVGA